MSTAITSITEIRAAARKRAERARATNRTVAALLGVLGLLLVIGLTSTLSASSTIAIRSTIDQGQIDRFLYFKQQLRGVGIGVVALIVAAKTPYRLYRRFAVPMFVTALVLLVGVLVIGVRIGGAKAWYRIGGFSFQPAEFAKFAVIVALATVLERKHKVLGDFGHYLAPVALIVGSVSLLVMLQPDLGTLIIIGGAAMAVLLTSSAPLRFVSVTGIGATVGATVLALADGERAQRLTSFLDPWADPSGAGYQVIQSWYALATGGLTGVGLGASRARWFYLPNAHNDFIFAIIGEETGFIGAITVIALFAALSVVGWSIAAHARDPFGRMLAAGLTAWISFQAIINIGGVIGALPITGVPLPFVSYGGTAVIVAMAAVGVLINIAEESRRSPRR